MKFKQMKYFEKLNVISGLTNLSMFHTLGRKEVVDELDLMILNLTHK